MAELKIKTHTTYTYETSDGREFDDAGEAQEWQQALEDIKSITMLDNKFNLTSETSSAYFVHIKTYFQLKAFELVQAYEGFATHIPDLGYWYYDEVADEYISVDKEIERLKEIKQRLNAFGN
jgi:hypothetical protein